MENFSYAIVQAMHNIGAVGVVAVPFIVYYHLPNLTVKKVNIYIALALGSWTIQIFSGIGFAITSNIFHGQIPQIDGVALVALSLKIASAVLSVIAYLSLILKNYFDLKNNLRMWLVLIILAFLPIVSAAFLRWYG